MPIEADTSRKERLPWRLPGTRLMFQYQLYAGNCSSVATSVMLCCGCVYGCVHIQTFWSRTTFCLTYKSEMLWIKWFVFHGYPYNILLGQTYNCYHYFLPLSNRITLITRAHDYCKITTMCISRHVTRIASHLRTQVFNKSFHKQSLTQFAE